MHHQARETHSPARNLVVLLSYLPSHHLWGPDWVSTAQGLPLFLPTNLVVSSVAFLGATASEIPLFLTLLTPAVTSWPTCPSWPPKYSDPLPDLGGLSSHLFTGHACHPPPAVPADPASDIQFCLTGYLHSVARNPVLSFSDPDLW